VVNRQPQVLFAFASVSGSLLCLPHAYAPRLTRSFALLLIRILISLLTHLLAHSHTDSHTAIHTCTRRTLVDYLTRTRARPVTWPPIAKDVSGTAKSVRGGRSVEKERIEARSGGREGEKRRDGGGDTGSGISPGVSGSSLF